jgi:Ca-activated chloride channel family protein
LWATRRVGYLLEQIRLNGANRELVDEIVALGTRFGIVTPYTSFLVTEDMKKDLAGRESRDERGRLYESLVGQTAGAAPAASGKSAVRRSQAEQQMKAADTVVDPDKYLNNVTTVGGKTFMLKDGVWTDTTYKANDNLPEVEVKFGAIGEKVIVIFKGKVYRVK